MVPSVHPEAPILVAGHCCLDVFPAFPPSAPGNAQPGALVDVGPALFAPGGAVSNVGIALARLGTPVHCVGRVGDDPFGQILLGCYAAIDAGLASAMQVVPGETTSYSIVLSPPGQDRIFYHCPGANHTFTEHAVPDQVLEGAALLHVGYPPLMRGLYGDGGEQLATLFARAQAHGVRTSLDMALPDPLSEAGQVDWPAWLRRVLPVTDIFAPSLDEMTFMLQPVLADLDLSAMSTTLLAWGAQIVLIKLGDRGLYLRTAPQLAGFGPSWSGRELLAPCFTVTVAGTTGAGDATIAGFLTALRTDCSPEDALCAATAVGATSVEVVDATSGIPHWTKLTQRIASGWATHPLTLPATNWIPDSQRHFAAGPHDRKEHNQ